MANNNDKCDNLEDCYYELLYNLKLTDYNKISKYTNEPEELVRANYNSLQDYYIHALEIDEEKYLKLKEEYKDFHKLYYKYYNESRKNIFISKADFMNWYNAQDNKCNYCNTTQEELLAIVARRNGNLTLNNKTKRSKGTLEIEKKDPDLGYTYDNSVLVCPFCNNAKSNLISYEDWIKYFANTIRQYILSLLKH